MADKLSDNNITNSNLQVTNNDVLVFENGTVLGSVIPINNSEIIDDTCNESVNCALTSCDNQTSVVNHSCSVSINSISILFDANSLCNTSNILENNCNSTNSNLDFGLADQQQQHPTEMNHSTDSHSPTELLNSSICSRDSRQNNGKRTFRKSFKQKTQQQDHHHHHLRHQQQQQQQNDHFNNRFPPQYTAIYLDSSPSGVSTTGGGGGAAAVAIGATTIPAQVQEFEDGNLTLSAVHRTSTSNMRRNCNVFFGFTTAFSRPSLPFVIGILALGGVACTLGGIVLGSTGLIEHSTQYLSAALLMIGIGVSLLVISGAIWRLSIPDDRNSDNNINCPSCYRQQQQQQHYETCRNCNSPYCTNLIIPAGFIYPEFQHRTPPPSYLTSIHSECTVGLLFNHEISNLQRNDSIRLPTPPPAYRPTNS